MLASCLIAFRIYQDNDSDITSFVAFGEDDPVRADYGRERLGEVFLRPDLGHDGKFFFIQANDPFLLDPEANASYLDDPVYRAQRMLYPVLAGAGGAASPEVIVWLMLLINLVGLGLGALAVGLIATHMGASAWWGLAFPLNVGLISEMSLDGAGVIAAAAGFAAVAAIQRERSLLGIGFLVMAALSREVMVIVAAGCALWLWRHGRKQLAVLAASMPVLAVALWSMFVRIRVESGSSGAGERLGWPFVGMWDAFEDWIREPVDLAIGVVLILLLVLFVRRVLLSDSLVGWANLGFVALALLLTVEVWRNYFDITRALAPVITAFVVLIAASDRGADQHMRAPIPPRVT